MKDFETVVVETAEATSKSVIWLHGLECTCCTESFIRSANPLAGDVILSIDGDMVTDRNRLTLAVAQRVPGSQIELEVRRGRESFETYATLIQQPPL